MPFRLAGVPWMANGANTSSKTLLHTDTVQVPVECHQQRLDVVVSTLCPHIPSRAWVQRLIQQGAVAVNGKVQTKPSYKVAQAQSLVVDSSALAVVESAPLGEAIALSILYEDDHILVVDKAAGMVVHPGAGVHSGTLVNAILAHCGCTLPSLGTSHRAGIVHRLDKDTSGVMVVAKSTHALTTLSRQFAAHAQTRVYVALVYGTPVPAQGRIETWHGRHAQHRLKYAVQPDGTGKKAILDYAVRTPLADGLVSLVECRLFTGRTHQIRVQMSHLGHGIIGDTLYTAPRSVAPCKGTPIGGYIKQHTKRHMLHASVLEFLHPVTQEPLSFEAPLPPDFADAMQFFGLYAPPKYPT